MSQNRSVHCNVTLYVTLLQLSVYSENLFVFFLKRLYDDDDDDDDFANEEVNADANADADADADADAEADTNADAWNR